MTSATVVVPAVARPALYQSVGFGNLLLSEWTKLRTLRSNRLSVIVIVLGTIGLGVFMGARWAHQHGSLGPGFDATNVSLSGVYLVQILVGVIAAMAISSEHTTGMIRASFCAVPQRRALIAAKALVVAVATLVLGEVSCFVAFGSGQALLAGKHAGVSLADPGVLSAVFGSGLYLTLVAVLGFGLGTAIRHTAGALAAFFGVLFAPSALVDLLPTSWRNTVIEYLPANAGSQILTLVHKQGALSAWAGLGVFGLYALGAVLAGFALCGRDS